MQLNMTENWKIKDHIPYSILKMNTSIAHVYILTIVSFNSQKKSLQYSLCALKKIQM